MSLSNDAQMDDIQDPQDSKRGEGREFEISNENLSYGFSKQTKSKLVFYAVPIFVLSQMS